MAGNRLDEALKLAEKAAAEGEVPVGAVVTCDGKIVGEGYNRRENRRDPTEHAEIMAIREAAGRLGSWRLEDCELHVTLEPCPMCLGAAHQARIKRIVYGAEDPKGGAISLGYRLHEDTRTNHRFIVEHHRSAECGEILREFFKKMRSEKKSSPDTP